MPKIMSKQCSSLLPEREPVNVSRKGSGATILALLEAGSTGLETAPTPRGAFLDQIYQKIKLHLEAPLNLRSGIGVTPQKNYVTPEP